MKPRDTDSTIFFCGDPHGHFDHIIEAVRLHRPAAIVLLGDLQPQQALEQVLESILDLTEIWWIHGNHDTDSDRDYDNLFGSALSGRNLHGRVAMVAGARIAGLGGIFRGQVWAPPEVARFESVDSYLTQLGRGNRWRGGLPRKHRSTIFPDEYEHLQGDQADILVTHEAPSCHPHGFTAIDDLARSLGVNRTFHGHHHEHIHYDEAEATRLGFQPFGVAYRGIRDQHGRLIHTSPLLESCANIAEAISRSHAIDARDVEEGRMKADELGFFSREFVKSLKIRFPKT